MATSLVLHGWANAANSAKNDVNSAAVPALPAQKFSTAVVLKINSHTPAPAACSRSTSSSMRGAQTHACWDPLAGATLPAGATRLTCGLKCFAGVPIKPQGRVVRCPAFPHAGRASPGRLLRSLPMLQMIYLSKARAGLSCRDVGVQVGQFFAHSQDDVQLRFCPGEAGKESSSAGRHGN